MAFCVAVVWYFDLCAPVCVCVWLNSGFVIVAFLCSVLVGAGSFALFRLICACVFFFWIIHGVGVFGKVVFKWWWWYISSNKLYEWDCITIKHACLFNSLGRSRSLSLSFSLSLSLCHSLDVRVYLSLCGWVHVCFYVCVCVCADAGACLYSVYQLPIPSKHHQFIKESITQQQHFQMETPAEEKKKWNQHKKHPFTSKRINYHKFVHAKNVQHNCNWCCYCCGWFDEMSKYIYSDELCVRE